MYRKYILMGKKYRIWLYVLVCAIILSGCGEGKVERNLLSTFDSKSAKADSGYNNGGADSSIQVRREEFLPNRTFLVENPEDVNLGDLLQKSASGVMVQITRGAGIGSGVIFSMDAEWVVIVTAAHVLEGEEEIVVLFGDGLRLMGDQSFIADGIDLGFIRIKTDRIPQKSRNQYCYAAVDMEAYDNLKTGDCLIVMGSIDGVAANAYEGSVLETWIYVEDMGQFMMIGKAYVKAGMSGGGVFDGQGHFIGIISGSKEESEILVVPLGAILSQYSLYSGQ